MLLAHGITHVEPQAATAAAATAPLHSDAAPDAGAVGAAATRAPPHGERTPDAPAAAPPSAPAAEGGDSSAPDAEPLEPPPLKRGLSGRSRAHAIRWHYTSLAAAFATSALVAGLLVAAGMLNSEALWAALV